MMELVFEGNVRTLLEGRVAEERLITADLNKMPYALGAGVFENEKGLQIGEAVVFEKKAYVYVPNQTWVQTGSLKTPFLMGILHEPKKSFAIHEIMTLSQFYEKMLQIFPNGFAILGSMNFSKLEVAYLKTPPIFHENINDHMEKYWAYESHDYSSAKIFGVVLHKSNPKAFYHNPNDSLQNGSYYSHIHALAKNAARHLLTQSMMVSARVWIEEIKPLS